MRILGFSKKWDKLNNIEFTTFRFPRKDRDWSVGEEVKIVFKPRRKGGGEKLGIAKIIEKESRCMAWCSSSLTEPKVTNEEAIADGFKDSYLKPQFGFSELVKIAYFFMWDFLWDCYGGERLLNEPMNKLTLRWIK